MIESTVEKMANPIGFEIGASDDTTQAALLNGFCDGMARSIQDRELDKQICFMVDSLNSNSFKVIKEIAGYIELAEKNPK